MSGPRYIVRCDFTNVQAEVLVNDIPVVFFAAADASPIAIPVNQYLLTGGNALSVRLHAGPVPERSGEPWPEAASAGYRGPGSFRATIGRYEVGETVARATPPSLATLSWEGDVATTPRMLSAEFRVTSATGGPWSWETGALLGVMNERLRREVLSYLARLHSLLAARRFAAFLEELAIKLRELDRAYAEQEGTMRAGLAEQLEAHVEAPWVLAPFEPSTIDLRVVASGRLVECQRTERGFVLEFRNDTNGDSFFLPLIVARRAGAWSVLR